MVPTSWVVSASPISRAATTLASTLASMSGCALALAALTPAALARPTMPHYQHVFVIIEENQGLADIISKPFTPNLTALAARYGLATQYYGVVHPSEGNYVAMLGGDTFGIHDDDAYSCKPGGVSPVCRHAAEPGYPDHTVAAPSLADQLAALHLTWKAYEESIPAAGAPDVISPADPAAHRPAALYASKHNGFMSFASVQHDPQRARRIVGFDALRADLAAGTMPAFAHIVPDQCDDMHGVKGTDVPADCTRENETGRIARGDALAGRLVAEIIGSPVWSGPGNSAIVITFDEASHHVTPGDPAGCCAFEPNSPANFGGGRIPTIVITNHGPRGLADATPYNHYSLLRTVEDAFGIATHLRHAADTQKGVVDMQPLFAVTH